MYEAGVERLQEMIDESSNIVFFGGAGVSTESGIPDLPKVIFRIFGARMEFIISLINIHLRK